jgi:hypothetical protein
VSKLYCPCCSQITEVNQVDEGGFEFELECRANTFGKGCGSIVTLDFSSFAGRIDEEAKA